MCYEMLLIYWIKCKGDTQKLLKLLPIQHSHDVIWYNWTDIQILLERKLL